MGARYYGVHGGTGWVIGVDEVRGYCGGGVHHVNRVHHGVQGYMGNKVGWGLWGYCTPLGKLPPPVRVWGFG